jgi:hypothetical protein
VWHRSIGGTYRLNLANNGPTYISGGSTVSTDNCFIVYASSTFGFASNLSILNHGNLGIGNINNSAYELHVNGTTYFQGYSIIGGDLQINGTVTAIFLSVANSGTDYVGVQVNASQGSSYNYPV